LRRGGYPARPGEASRRGAKISPFRAKGAKALAIEPNYTFARRAIEAIHQQLGERADLNYKYLGAIERGEENPSLIVLQRIATAVEIELSDLFRFAHEETSPKALRKSIDHLLAVADTEKLQLACKLLKALLK
jgi:DNA-binding XRE family transcriptional regulator